MKIVCIYILFYAMLALHRRSVSFLKARVCFRRRCLAGVVSIRTWEAFYSRWARFVDSLFGLGIRGNDVSGHCKEASCRHRRRRRLLSRSYEVSCRVGARGSNVSQNNKKEKEEMYVVRVKSSQVLQGVVPRERLRVVCAQGVCSPFSKLDGSWCAVVVSSPPLIERDR